MLPYSSRNFSASSERYIVHQIHNTIAESSCDLPSNPAKSVELESSRILESVAETEEGDAPLCDGAVGQDSSLPSEDNIEKSFRVNQDGSMTVEMKVRLTIKEEETVQWTTTLTRSSVADQLNVTCLPEPEAEQEICSAESDSVNSQSPAASIDTIDKDKTKDNNDDDPPSLGNGALSHSSNEDDDDVKIHTDVPSPRRPPTPGFRKMRKQQASVGSIKSITPDGIQEEMVGSYSYREQTESGTITEQYCMVKENTTRPVPKPRRFNSFDTNSRNVSEFKSSEITQTHHAQSSGEEVTETVLHIYEHQTCQDNFLANVCSQGMSASAVAFSRPATSDTGHLSSNNEYEPELWRPSTASESISIWRAESMSVTSETHLPSWKTAAFQGAKRQQFQKLSKGREKTQQREVSKDVRTSSKPVMINKHARRPTKEGKRQKETSAEADEERKKVKPFSSAGFIKRIYGNKLKSAKGTKKLKKRSKQNREKDFTAKSSPLSDASMKTTPEDLNIQLKEKKRRKVSFEASRMSVSPPEVIHPRGVLTRQTSMHMEKKNKTESDGITESMTLPAFNSSNSATKKYVESWLENANMTPPSCPEEESKKSEAVSPAQTETGRCRETEKKIDQITEAEDVKCLEKTSEMQASKLSEPPAETPGAASVKLRAQAFENKSSPSMEKVTVAQSAHNHVTNIDTNQSKKNTPEAKPLSNGTRSEVFPSTIETTAETALEGEVGNAVKISFENATPTNTPSLELPPPPSPEQLNSECCSKDVLSVASSPLYGVSSTSSQISDSHASSASPKSDKAASPTEKTMEKTTPTQTDIPSTLQGKELSRTPSIKRAPLVSNLSLERKMSLRKARLDKYTSGNDAAVETAALSPPINTAGDEVPPHDICSTGTQQALKAPPEETQEQVLDPMSTASVCSSLSPSSLTSDERMSTASISSSEASVSCNPPFKETTMNQREEEPSKTLGKSVKLKSSPSPERKIPNKKPPAEPNKSPKLAAAHTLPLDKNVLPSTAVQKHATPNASPSTERKHHKSNLKQRPSPYSKSLDVMSPPVRHKSSGKMPPRNLSADSHSETVSRTQKKASTESKSDQTSQSKKATAELCKTSTCDAVTPPQDDQSEEIKIPIADRDEDIPVIQQSLNTANQPNMKPVLEEICYSIKAIRQVTQNKRPSCLEKSNSLPDFSSHVASTFGSSSKALLAFLSVMTLKDGLTNLNVDELNANDVSCAEALKMIDSLREIASIEDSHTLKTSLLNLQQSASEKLLKSWRGFQELGDRCISRSSTPNAAEPALTAEAGPVLGFEETVIDEIMDNLDVPEKLKEELSSLSEGAKSESDSERISARITDRPEQLEDRKSPENPNHIVTQDAPFQAEGADADVGSIIRKVTDLNKQGQRRKDNIQDRTEATTKNPQAEPSPTQNLEERQLYSSMSFDLPSLSDDIHQESQEKQIQQLSHNDENLTKLEKGSHTLNMEEQDVEHHQVHVQNEECISEDELASDEKSHPDENVQNISSANKELDQRESSRQSSGAGEQYSSEGEERKHESGEAEDQSEEGEDKQLSHSYVEMNVTGKKIAETGSMGVNISTDESTGDSEADEPSEEEQSAADCKKLQVIVEESLSDCEEDQEDEHICGLPNFTEKGKKHTGLGVLIEEAEEDQISSGDEDLSQRTGSRGLSNLKESQDSTTQKENSSWIISDSLGKDFGFNADDDSGNDHSSCEEHLDEEQIHLEDGQISSSVDEELSFCEKESSSEAEPAHFDRCTDEGHTRHQEAHLLTIRPDEDDAKAVENLKHHSEDVITQSVAERVILLEKQVTEAQKAKNTSTSSAVRRFSQRKTSVESDEEDSTSGSPTSALAYCTRSAPQSSLSFSYDSSGVITSEPEGSRVRSIREMFLAKSATDVQHKRLPSSNSSELSDLRAETSGSGGYQSQASSEQSSGEDDSARKSITKGFVRRTIERLYGKKDATTEEANERAPSEQSQGKKEQSSIFSPLHAARSKAMSEFSYFSSTNALDAFSEATRCIAFNVQVGPGDGVPLDNRQWLIRENTLIRKSVSDPVGIHKTFTSPLPDEGLGKDTPYSLFSTKLELEDSTKALPQKCTYFSLPHASDSDICQDDVSTVSKGSVNGDSNVEAEDPKTWTERNGLLPSAVVTDFKMMDNKVHPLVEHPADGEVVVVQPGKGQGLVNRRLQEPDVLDLLYNFCGEHCPIL